MASSNIEKPKQNTTNKSVVPPKKEQVITPVPKPLPKVTSPQPPQSTPISQGDERTWGMLAHLSVLLNLVTGLGGPIAALIIYLVYKDRSRFIAYHSLQSMVFQLIWWVGGGAIAGITWAISGVLSAVFIGLLCMPIACLFSFLPLGGLIYGIVGAVQTSQGQDFKYWLVGDWMRGTLTGK